MYGKFEGFPINSRNVWVDNDIIWAIYNDLSRRGNPPQMVVCLVREVSPKMALN